MKQIKLIANPAYLMIPETPLYVSAGIDKAGTKYDGLTLKNRLAQNNVDAFSEHDFCSSEDFEHCLTTGRIKQVGKVGRNLRIKWDESLFEEAEKLAVLEARNIFRRQNGLPNITLDDCILRATEATKSGKKESATV